MNDFEFDVLTRFAYGEEEPGDREVAAQLMHANPAAKSYVDECRAMQSGVLTLADVPECRLTSQDIRTAVQVLQKPRKTLYMPLSFASVAAAAAVVAGFMFFNRGHVPLAVSTPVIKTDVASSVPPRTSSTNPVTSTQDAPPVDAAVPVTDTSSVPAPVAAPSPGTALAVTPDAKPALTEPETPSTKSDSADSSPDAARDLASPAAGAPVGSSLALTSDSVVVVGQVTDPDTGAPSAKEVKTTDGIEFSG